MDKIIDQLLNEGLEQLMDKTRKELALSDEIYKRDGKDERELRKRYIDLDLSKNQRMIVNDYIACVKTVDNRYSDLSYLAGIQDTIKFLIGLGLLKKQI